MHEKKDELGSQPEQQDQVGAADDTSMLSDSDIQLVPLHDEQELEAATPLPQGSGGSGPPKPPKDTTTGFGGNDDSDDFDYSGESSDSNESEGSDAGQGDSSILWDLEDESEANDDTLVTPSGSEAGSSSWIGDLSGSSTGVLAAPEAELVGQPAMATALPMEMSISQQIVWNGLLMTGVISLLFGFASTMRMIHGL